MASYYDAWKKSRGEEDDDKKKQQTISGESTSTSDNNLVKEESKTSYYEAWMKSRGEEIPVDKPKEQKIESEPVKDVKKPVVEQKKNIWEKIKDTFQKLRKLTQAPDDGTDSDVDKEARKRMEESTMKEVPTSEVLKRYQEDPVGYLVSRPYYSSKDKYLEQDKDLSTKDVMQKKLQAYGDYYNSLDEVGKARLTNPVEGLSDDSYAYIKLNTDNILKETDLEIQALYSQLETAEGKDARQIKKYLGELEEQKKDLEYIQKGVVENKGFIDGLAEGFTDVKNIPVVGSIIRADEAIDTLRAWRKYENGEDLSTREKMLVNRIKTAEIESISEEKDIGYNIASGVATSVSLMVEVGLALAIPTPVDGEIALATRGASGVGKFAIGAGNLLWKAGKITATTGVPKIIESTATYQSPEMSFDWEENDFDKIEEGDEFSDALLKSIAKEYGNNLIEVGLGDTLDASTKAVKKGIANMVGKEIQATSKNQVITFLRTKGGWNGFLGEFSEEIAQKYYEEGIIDNKEVKFTPEELVAIAGSVLLLQGAGEVVGQFGAEQDGMREQIEAEAEANIRATVQEADKRTTEEGGGTVQEEIGKQDTPVVDVEEEMLKADIAQVEQGLKAEPVQEVKIEEGKVKTDYSEDAKVQEVLRDISMVLDIGARKKVTSMDEVTGDYRSGVDGVIIPEFIPEELRSRKYVQKAYDAFLNNTVPQEGTKAWQVYQAILDESKGREGLEIQEPEITTERIQDTIKVDGLNEEQQLEIAKDVWAKSSGSDAFENANQPIANAKSFDEVIKIIKEVSGSNYDAVISSYGIALDTRFNILRRREVNKTQKEQVKEGKFALKVEKLRKDAPAYITDLNVSDEAVNIAFEKLTGADIDIKDIPADLRTEVQKALDAINGEMDKRIAEDTSLQVSMEEGFTKEELAGYLAMDVLEDREYEAEMQKELTPLEEDVITDDDLPFRQRELKVLEDKFLDNLNIERMKEFSREWFGDENVEVVKNILRNNKALGMYLNRLIEIKNGQAHVGSTFYHEAVHKAFDIFLTADEKSAMIKEVVKRVGRDNLMKEWNGKTSEEKLRLASYWSSALASYELNLPSVRRAGVGIEDITKRSPEWSGKDNLLKSYADSVGIKSENLYGSSVQYVDAKTGERVIFLVDGEMDAVHAQSLIDGTEFGLAGEQVDGKTWHITALKPSDFENPYTIVEGKFDPRDLPYSKDASQRSKQREYRNQFGITKNAKGMYRGADSQVTSVDAMAEEWLAENIIDYINNRNSTTFWGKLKRMVDIFVDRVFRGIDHVKDIEDFYESLISGRLLDRQQKLEAKRIKNFNKYLTSIAGAGTKTDVVYRMEVAKEVKKLTTKILKKLEGKDSVKKQFISDLTKQQDIKQVEKDIINDVLKTFPDDIDVATFEEKVLAQLLPLERETLSSSQYAMVTVPSSTDSLGYSDWDYSENIYTSPIEVKAGLQHFGFSTEDQEMLKRDQDIVDRYFGHTRVENSKDTRRVLEVQSDLYQKGVLEKELNAIKPQLNIFNVENKAQVQTLLGEPKAKEYGDLWQGVYDGQFDPSKKIGEKGLKRMTELETEAINIAQSRLDESNLSQYKNPTAHLRMVREEVRQASLDNVKTLLFPTGKTSAYIEGFLKPDRFKNTKGEIIHNVKGLKYGDIITDSQTNNEWIVLSVNDNGMQNRIFAKPMSSVLTKDSKDLELSSGGVLDTLIKSFGFDFYMKGKKLIPKDSEEIVKYIRSKGGKVSAELFIELLRRDASTAYKTVGLANGYTGDPLALNAVIKKEGFDGNDLIDIADIHKDFTWSGEAFYIGETQNYEKVLGNPEWKATVDFYEKDLGKYLKNNYEAKEFVDEDGYTWWKVDIKPEYAGAVEAFRLDELVDYGKVAKNINKFDRAKLYRKSRQYLEDITKGKTELMGLMSTYKTKQEFLDSMLFHGSSEGAFDGKFTGDGYDGVFIWTTDSPKTAQNYIPDVGSKKFISFSSRLDDAIDPSEYKDWKVFRDFLGLKFKDVKWDSSGRYADSWVNLNPVTRREAKKKLEKLGYTFDEYGSIEQGIIEVDGKIQKPDYKEISELYIFSGKKNLNLKDVRVAEEGDLMDVDYNKFDEFKKAKDEGYDGVIINDFGQSDLMGNYNHTSFGLFEKGYKKLQQIKVPAQNFDEWDTYKGELTPELDALWSEAHKDTTKYSNSLIAEAKKYKNAEEFVKAQEKPHYISIEDIKSSFDADTFSNLKGTPRNQNINLLNEYKSIVKRVEKSPIGREITKPISVEFNVDGGNGYRIVDGNHRYLQALKNGDKRILAKFDTLKGTSQERKNIFQEKTKSQLTDIWNKSQQDTAKYRLEEEVSVKLPELITMATELGANIKLQKSFRKGGKLGDFTAGEDTDSRIRILRTLFEPQGEEVMDGEGNVEKLPETPEQQMDRIHGIEKVLAHEIGHLFDWFGGTENMTLKRGNILGRIANLRSYTEGQFMDLENKDIRRELKTLTQVWNPFDEASVPKKYKTYRYSAKELYAEALSVFLNKPSLVKEVAPNFYQGFIEYMARKKEVQKEYFAIRDMIKQGNEVQSRVENMKKAQEIARGKRMTIGEEKEAYRKQSKWQKGITGIKMGFVNQYAPYLDKLRKAWKEKKITLSKLEEAEQLMGDLALKGNDAVKYAQDVQNEFFVPVSEAGIDIDTVGMILELERDLGDRKDLANPHGLVYDYAKETYDYVKGQLSPAQWNLLSEKLSWWRDYNFELVKKGYEAGVYSEQFFNEIATVNKNTYTPFAVVDYIEDNYVTAGVIQATGTTKGVENPLTTQMLKSLSLMKLTATNGAKQDVVKSLSEIFPEEIVKADAIKDADGRTIGFKKNPKLERSGYTQLEILEDGKRTAYYMDKYIVSMFESSLNGVGWEIARFVTAPLRMVNRIFKPAVTVMKASFQFYSNPLKDYQRSLTNLTALSGLFDKSNVASRTGKVFTAFTKEWIKNLKRSWNYAGGEIDAVTQKMLDMYVLSSNVKYEDIDIGNEKFKFDPVKNRIVYKGGVNWLETLRDFGSTIPVIKHTLVPVYDFYMRAGSTFEVNSKIAGFQYLSEKVGEEKASFYTRRYVGTPDYMQKGKFTPLTNELVVFSNVGIQAITADMDLATRPKTASGYWVSTMFKIVFPKLLMLLGASILRVPIPDPDDPEKKKWVNPYDYLSEYYKSMYMAFPIGYDEESESFMFVKTPSDEVGAVIGNLVWKMATYLQGEGMKVEQLGSAIAGLVPFTTGENPLLSIMRDWKQYLQGRNPYDDFRGRLAINTSKWNEGGMTRFTEMLKWTTNELGVTNFSTYDKSSDTTLEKTMNLPLLERMFELTNYGLQEREENDKALGKKEKNKTLDGYIESYYAEPSNKKLLELQEKYVIAIKGERPKGGWSGTEKAEETRLKSEFKREILANSGNAVYKSIAKAGLDNEQKLEIINKQKKKMSDEEFKDFMAQAVRYEVVKGEMFATYVKDKNLSQDLVYKVVKESIPVLSADSNNTLLWELRKVDAMSNDTLYQLAKDGLITSAGYMKYKDLNSTSYEKRYGDKEEETKTKLF